ncbi:MAG: hypothetical protein D6689_20535 [Deltaproteobacteria bacterium]|nr:MAG: hypothetical protein D6689_20535 [Deltaproteobacteria bacterium]
MISTPGSIARIALLAAAVTVSAASTTVKQQRAALVPHQQPVQRSGQPIGDNRAEVALGTSTLSVLTKPEIAEGANAGLYIPRVHASGAVRFRATPRFDIGLLWDHGLKAGALSIQDGQPPLDEIDGDVYGGGLTMQYAADVGVSNFSLGLGFDLLFYSVPYVEYSTYLDVDGRPVFTDIDHERDTVPVFAFGVVPSWKLSPRLTVFGGVTARNHPTIKRLENENVLDESSDDVEGGPLNFVANAGVEFTFGNGLRAMLHMFQPMNADPVRYGPTFGAAVAIPLARDSKPAAAR